jgi:hypothetical protein
MTGTDMGIKFERKFLQTDELLQRWQCSDADLKYEIIEGNLPPLIFVNKPDEITDREGFSVFGPDEDYILRVDDLFGPIHGHLGYLVLRSPIREGINTCSFSAFSQYQEVWDECIAIPPRMIPLEKYWGQMVFDIPTVLQFEAARTEGVSLPDSNEKPLSNRERDTLLTIIAALCKDAGYDSTKHAKTAGLIQSTAAGMGVSIGESTIEGHLKKIPNALAGRKK